MKCCEGAAWAECAVLSPSPRRCGHNSHKWLSCPALHCGYRSVKRGEKKGAADRRKLAFLLPTLMNCCRWRLHRTCSHPGRPSAPRPAAGTNNLSIGVERGAIRAPCFNTKHYDHVPGGHEGQLQLICCEHVSC